MTWLATTSDVRSNHQALSWFSTWPLNGTPAITRSKADNRSVVMKMRFRSP